MRDDDSPDRLLNRAELRELIPVSDMTLWRWQRKRTFPQPVRINRRRYWWLSDVRKWLAAPERAAAPEEF